MSISQPRLTRTQDQFIREIIEDANRGRCFIPFLGSGLSSASGIIMGLEFTNYLAFASYLVLAEPRQRSRTHGEGKTAAWDIQRQGWPPPPSQREVEQATAWIKREFQVICGRYQVEPNYEEGLGPGHGKIKSLTPVGRDHQEDIIAALVYPPIPQILRSNKATEATERYRGLTKLLAKQLAADDRQEQRQIEDFYLDRGLSYEEQIREKGIRALVDWKSTLTFLSRVRIADDQGPSQRLYFDAPSAPVIDAFNQFMTRDKKPNLGHKVIAHLSGPLRFFTILTTNFDKLTEEAYRMLRLNLVVFPVLTSSGLPDERTIAASDALIKVHGESHDTRADLSLDEEPTSQDKATFAAYMTRGRGHLQAKRNGRDRTETTTSNRLLVIGYSGSDHRCVQMIKHWLETATDDPRVYWICFSESDVKKVKRLFISEKFSGRIRIVQTARPDLLLYELYQRLTFSLPPGGTTYEFSHLLPPNREAILDNSETRVNETFATLELELAHSPNPCATYPKEMLRDIAVKRIEKYILDAVRLCVPDKLPKIDRSFVRIAKWHPKYREADIKSLEPLADFHPAYVIDGCAGVVRAASLASQRLTSEEFRKVFWMEMEDYMDGDAMLREFLRTLALRHGQFQSRHVTMHPFAQRLPDSPPADDDHPCVESQLQRLVSHLRSVMTQYRVDPTSIVVMIYGRDSYGTCSGIWHSPWTTSKSDAQESREKPDAKRFFQLHFLIEAFARAGIPAVYFPLTERRAQRKRSAAKKIVRQYVLAQSPEEGLGQEDYWVHDPHDCFPMSPSSDTYVGFEEMAVECSVSQDIIHASLKKFFKRDLSVSTKSMGNKPEFVLDTNRVDRNRLRQLEFLYALSLFRHARHANAVCSEAVYPCPYRYNMLALDNDFIRSIESRSWLRDFRRARLFLNKPGGEFWMHRDTRIIIRQILESIPIRDVFATEQPSDAAVADTHSTPRGHERMLEARARIHFWIADWYQKAFLSCGHLGPVLHALHHCVMAAAYAKHSSIKRTFTPDDQPANVENKKLYGHRTMLFESAVVQASKTLLLAWRWIELWQASPCKPAWMDPEIGCDYLAILRTSVQNALGCKRSREGAQLDKAQKAGLLRLESEINTFKTILQSIGTATTLAGVTSGKQTCSNIDPQSITHWIKDLEVTPGNDTSVSMSISHDLALIGLDNDNLEMTVEKLFSRTQTSKSKQLIAAEIWKQIKKISDAPACSLSHDQIGSAKAGWKLLCGRQPRALHSMVWLLGEVAYLMLKRAKLEFHARGKISQKRWTQSTIACNLGIDMCKHLPPSLLAFEMASKIKMHSIYSIGLANLGRFFEANRHLNEAQALLSKFPGGTDADHAIIALRRAEVKLTECFWIQQFLGRDGTEVTLMTQGANDRWVKFHDKFVIRATNRHEMNNYFILPDLFSNAVDCWHADEFSGASTRFEDAKPDNYSFVPPNVAECFRVNRPPGFLHPDTSDPEPDTPDFNPAAQDSEKPSKDSELCELWFRNSQKSLVKLFASVLDESVILLEKAEVQLGGSSQHAMWWSRLRLLQLRVYGLLPALGAAADTCIIFRKQSADIGIYSSFSKLVQIAGDDLFLLLRALRYFLEANEWYSHHFGTTFLSRGDRMTFDAPPTDAEERLIYQKKRVAYQRQFRSFYRSFLPDSFKIADEVYQRLKGAVERPEEEASKPEEFRPGAEFNLAFERLTRDYGEVFENQD